MVRKMYVKTGHHDRGFLAGRYRHIRDKVVPFRGGNHPDVAALAKEVGLCEETVENWVGAIYDNTTMLPVLDKLYSKEKYPNDYRSGASYYTGAIVTTKEGREKKEDAAESGVAATAESEAPVALSRALPSELMVVPETGMTVAFLVEHMSGRALARLTLELDSWLAGERTRLERDKERLEKANKQLLEGLDKRFQTELRRIADSYNRQKEKTNDN